MGGLGIPGVWLKGPGKEGFDAACREALAACGIDPDNFGTYSQRLAAQAQARDDYRAHRNDKAEAAEKRTGKRPAPPEAGGHEGGCPLATNPDGHLGLCSCHETPAAKDWYAAQGRPNDFLVANAESGHEGQNATCQNEGGRGDPCANVTPPNPGSGADGGSYGYDMQRAACMDHYGAANVPGTPHYEITKGEVAFGLGVTPDLPGGRLSRDAMRGGVKHSALCAVRGPNPSDYPGTTPRDAAAQQRATDFATNQKAQAARLSAREGVANTALTDADRKAVEDKAADCIVSHWDAVVDGMRVEAMDKFSCVSKSPAYDEQRTAENKVRADARKAEKKRTGTTPKEPAPVERFSDLPPERQQAVVRAQATKDLLDKEQGELVKQKGATQGQYNAAGGEPTRDDCRQYQANWLLNATHGPTGTGALPAFSGRPPYKGPSPTTPGEPVNPISSSSRTGE